MKEVIIKQNNNFFLYKIFIYIKRNWHYILRVILSFLLGSYLWYIFGIFLIYIFLPSLLTFDVIDILYLIFKLLFSISGIFLLCGYRKAEFVLLLYSIINILSIVIINLIESTTFNLGLINYIYLIFNIIIIIWFFKSPNKKTGFFWNDKFLVVIFYLVGSNTMCNMKTASIMLIYGGLDIVNKYIYYSQIIIGTFIIYIIVNFFCLTRITRKIKLTWIILTAIFIIILFVNKTINPSKSATMDIIYIIVVLFTYILTFYKVIKFKENRNHISDSINCNN